MGLQADPLYRISGLLSVEVRRGTDLERIAELQVEMAVAQINRYIQDRAEDCGGWTLEQAREIASVLQDHIVDNAVAVA